MAKLQSTENGIHPINQGQNIHSITGKLESITAENTALKLPNGSSLVLITENGEVIQQGTDLLSQIFHAVKTQVVAQVFSTVRPIAL